MVVDGAKRPVCGDFFHSSLYFHRYNYYRLQAAITRPLCRCEVSPRVSAAGNSISVPQRLSLHGKGSPTICYVQCMPTRICGPLFQVTPLHAGSSAPPTNKKHVRAYLFPRITRSAVSETQSLRDPYCTYIHMDLTAIFGCALVLSSLWSQCSYDHDVY